VSIATMLNKAAGLPVIRKEPDETGSRLLPSLRPSNNGGKVTRPPGLNDIFNAFYECPAVFTAIRAIANSIGDIPFVLVEMEESNEKRKFRTARSFYRASRSKNYTGITEKWAAIEGGKVVRHHPLLTVLENPSPASMLTGHMLKAAIVAFMELTGMSYVEKLFAKDEKTLTGLWPLVDPRKMMVVAGEKKLIDGYVWVGHKGIVTFQPEDMVYFRSFHPGSAFYGYSPTQALRVIIAGDIKAITWNHMFFTNGARPDGILASKGRLNDGDVDGILDAWDDAHRDEENWHRPAVMGNDMTWVDVGSSHRDMDFPELRTYSKEEILAAYGVPPIIGGDWSDANRASSDVMYKWYYEGCILPRCDLIEDMLNMCLVPPGSGFRLVFDLGAIEALKGDLLEMAKVGARVKEEFSINERRVFLWNLPIIDSKEGNAIWDPKRENIVGYAPLPSEVSSGSNDGDE